MPTGGVGFSPDPDSLLARIVSWAQADRAALALLLLGSRARSDRPADEWSDTDLILILDDTDGFLADPAWPAPFGTVAITVLEETRFSLRERRVLYADGADLDVVPMTRERMAQHLGDPHALMALGRGHRVLVDKIAIFVGLEDRIASAKARGASHPEAPEPAEFTNVVNDFWYHAVWTARKLRRGELWVARSCLDGHMKRLLLKVIEWRADLAGARTDHWFDGRFLERWADPSTLTALRDSFAHYDPDDVARALQATMDLFRRLATDLAVRRELPYPTNADTAATHLVTELLQPVGAATELP
jgi:aminoglycoside 6-adenylyltransferase